MFIARPVCSTPCWAESAAVTTSIPPIVEVMDGVKEVHRIVSPYKLASRSFRPGGTIVKIKDVEIGGNRWS